MERKCSRCGAEKTYADKFSHKTKDKGSTGVTRHKWEYSIKLEN